MKAVLSMGWQLICFRAGPDALPYAPRLLLPLLALNLLLSFALQSLAGEGMDKPVVALSAMAMGAEAVWLAFLLHRRDWINRWVQSFMALVLVDTLITLMAAPPAMLLVQGGGVFITIAALLQVVMTLWSISARGFVYQSTLGIPRWRGVLLALVPLFIVMLLTLQFFPDLIPTAPQGS
ncbi:MAG: hypothetical protein AABY68_13525 [Pseudomonadota bacterium]